MRVAASVLGLTVVLVTAPASGQSSPGVQGDAGVGEQFERNTDGYAFPSLATTVARMQNVAHAMRLRDYCTDRRVPDAFVRIQLERFSLITGRPESCASLLDY